MTAVERHLPLYSAVPQTSVTSRGLETVVVRRITLLLRCSRGPRGGQVLAPSRGFGADDPAADDPSGDAVAHFVLRLGFCETPALVEWFVTREVVLLRLRWAELAFDDQARELAALGIRVLTSPGRNPVACIPFASLPPQSIAQRRVVVTAGLASTTLPEAFEILAVRFAQQLREALELIRPRLAEICGRNAALEQVVQRLRVLGASLLRHNIKGHRVATVCGGDLNTDNFEECLERSFPPCMRRLVEHQRTGEHLRHLGRLQLRAFQRSAGLSFREALGWWQHELLRDARITKQGFEQNYRYDVEHAWGQRGHGRGAFPYSCSRLLEFPARTAGQQHGCPFQGLAATDLARELAAWGVPRERLGQVLSLAVRGHARSACAEFFRATHPGFSGRLQRTIAHPNAFFRMSREHVKAMSRGVVRS